MRSLIVICMAAAIAVGGLAGAGQAPEMPARPRSNWNQLTPQERAELKKRREQFRQLPSEQQRKLRERYREYLNLSPGQRQKLRERWLAFKQLSPEQKKRIQARHRQWQEMPEEKRRRMRQTLQDRFKRMNDEQLGDFFRKLNIWRTLSDEEQKELYQRFVQFRQEHRAEAKEHRTRLNREP